MDIEEDFEEVLQGKVEPDNVPRNNSAIETGRFVLGTNLTHFVSRKNLYRTLFYEKHQAHNLQNEQVHFHIFIGNNEQLSINIDGSFHDGNVPNNGTLSKGILQALKELNVAVEKIPKRYLSNVANKWILSKT